MKLTTAHTVRAKVVEAIMAYFVDADEDCGMITSNSFNFPITEDGEEGWVEVVVKIPKDDGDEGYMKRDEYQLKCEEKEAKAKEKAEAKARKIERDKAEREARKKAKEEKDA